FYLKMPTEESRDGLIRHLAGDGIVAPFHYVPLDTSAAGVRYGRTPQPCVRSAEFSASILRLPLWPMLTFEQQDRVIGSVLEYKQA
ncbi:DegT/DnrJ/EryC1/StrS family aminotransferase, partial [Rhodococcus qingshengii]